jgi:amidase
VEPIIDRSELGSLDAVETAARIRAGDLDPKTVVAAAIERAQRFEGELNAIATETFDAALTRADAPLPGPFSGVPTFIKGLDDEQGVLNEHGSRAFSGNIARRTEPFVRRFLETGLVSLGHSTAPEIGLNVTTESLAHGPTRNPWNLEHSTGGSSGGAAALVAARVVPLAHASDAGGSIRIPASSCGLVGLKPSRARGLTSALANLLPIRVFNYGAVTRSVRDSAHFSAVMEAHVLAPRASRKLPAIGLVEGPASERLRIGVYTDSPLGNEVDAEVREATLAAGRACSALGHHVEEIACPYEGRVIDDVWTYFGFIAFAVGLQTRALQRSRYEASNFEPWTRGLASLYQRNWLDSIGLIRRLRAVQSVSARLFSQYDILLCPTLSRLPPRIGELRPDRSFEELLPLEKQLCCFTPIQNVTGEPAISLPLAVSRSGLPIGVQAAAEPGGEARLLALAYELVDGS